ncbi:hypothetical protein GCM10027085_04230 [Spirosoma aerophilum]
MEVAELRQLHQLEKENRQLKQLVIDLSPDKQMLQGVLKNALRPVQQVKLASSLMESHWVSARGAYSVVKSRRYSLQFKSRL